MVDTLKMILLDELTQFLVFCYYHSQGINAGTGDSANWVIDVVTGLVVFLQSIFIIGLRVIGQNVSVCLHMKFVDYTIVCLCVCVFVCVCTHIHHQLPCPRFSFLSGPVR
jgi:succinate dehydrogenase hydrophobic anchor subunit